MDNNLIFKSNIPVTRPKLPDFKNYTNKISELWDSRWVTNDGLFHEEFKEKIKTYLNVNQVELFSNGHMSLELAIKSLSLKGEVITTPFTFVSTIHALTNCGLKPVFCDINPEDFNIDSSKIEELITEKTSAILAVHVFGIPCNVEEIDRIAKKYNLRVIYDAAHAFGVRVDGNSIANYGDITMFSLHATKVMNSIEGGILVYKDINLKEKLKALKNFGIVSQESIKYIGTNAKMNEFQAAMGILNIEDIDKDISQRKEIHEKYIEILCECVETIRFKNNAENNYAYFPILLKDKITRDWLHNRLKEYNVTTRKYFYPLCNDIECYDYSSENTPIAGNISDRILVLPMFTDLNISDVKKVSEIVNLELGVYNAKI
ncbi:DegT/DnrJ/EryC1/StrS family aminotransferase [Cytobacillus sp. FSL K6-0129]|uniref:DegT/DnrJ/EryC1/StrS family aminotransferase n=1 Tax=Cytobacillus sp. FSL K6-0129 TaxID=2921421 RepID=UPI0030F65152